MLAELPLPAGRRGAWTTRCTRSRPRSPRADIRLTTRFDEGYIWRTALLGASCTRRATACTRTASTRSSGARRCARPASLGFHESQSRMWENWVGRSRPFWSGSIRGFASAFPEQFDDVDPETLYRAANKVEPSLIRVEADQVTYNLHIVLRFELELEIFEGGLELADLPEAWNARMAEYLGVEVPDDAHGVLQDVHWAEGLRLLPDLLAGQHDRRPDLGGGARGTAATSTEQIARGELVPLRDWLREHLYRHGGKFPPKEMIERLVGGPIDVGPYLRQLRERAVEIYGI